MCLGASDLTKKNTSKLQGAAAEPAWAPGQTPGADLNAATASNRMWVTLIIGLPKPTSDT